MRCFISIDIPEDIKDEIVEIQKDLEEQNLFSGKLTEKENLHLTLKFLGELDEQGVKRVRKKLGEIKFKKFKSGLENLGVFTPNLIKIIWITLAGCGELQKEIDEKLSSLFGKEERFMSHLTIARVKSVKDKEKFISELGKIDYEKKEFCVSEFKLKKSTLTEKGPVYEDIEVYNLT